MSGGAKATRLRDLKAGERFYLLRTMERYIYLGTNACGDGVTRHIVRRESEARNRDLHHSCHVKRIVRAA